MPAVRTATLVALVALAPGCKWLGGDKGGSSPSAREQPDPLLGMRRIDPQSGVLGRDPVAKNGERDPLTYQPANRGRAGSSGDLPPRTTANDLSHRAPFRPSLADSPAALAGGNYDSDLTINRGDAEPPPAATGEVTNQLKSLGAAIGTPARTDNGWTVTATVPLGGEPPGSRRFTGSGPTPEAATKSALEQVKANR